MPVFCAFLIIAFHIVEEKPKRGDVMPLWRNVWCRDTEECSCSDNMNVNTWNCGCCCDEEEEGVEAKEKLKVEENLSGNVVITFQ